MYLQTVCSNRWIVTSVAFVWFFSRVSFQMSPQTACMNRSHFLNLYDSSPKWLFKWVLNWSVWTKLLAHCMHSLHSFVFCLSFFCPGLHRLWQPGCEKMEREWENEEEMEKYWENSLSTFPHFLFIFSFSIHFLCKKLSDFVAKW